MPPVRIPADPAVRHAYVLARALAHPSRLVILRALLTRGRLGCEDLAAETELKDATVRQHLRILERTGFVERGAVPARKGAGGPGRPLHVYRASDCAVDAVRAAFAALASPPFGVGVRP